MQKTVQPETIMNSIHAFFVLGALLFLAPAAQARLEIVATTPDLSSIASEIAGSHGSVTTLAKPTEDPHFVDAKPSFIVKLNRADAVIEGGAELEIGWLPALLDQSRNPRLAPGAPGRISCAQGISLLQIPATLDRSRGDIHAAGNPHFMTDPHNAKIVAEYIASAFCQLDPKSCDSYRANLGKFTAELESKSAEWEKVLAPFKGQRIVAYHDTWPYFARRFGLNIDLFLEPKPGIPPTPVHLADVVSRMKADHINVILVEPYQNRKTAEAVAADTGAPVVDVAQFPGGVRATEKGYIELMDYLVHSVARALAEGKK